ncbi:hypothetical protein EON67_04485 [archaeon]|nr:MAG: hypothetical protein EON67_04485 [archaeon]
MHTLLLAAVALNSASQKCETDANGRPIFARSYCWSRTCARFRPRVSHCVPAHQRGLLGAE